ncbi:hypothetical protein [Vibrio diazotrophicus]|uniref:hypothetical protein n=1 Tax=Vibrio diazotrophicus TaxID=685 RepID=UPI0015E15148|nr:hypothetical protein [Vibrio diazotrophicus]
MSAYVAPVIAMLDTSSVLELTTRRYNTISQRLDVLGCSNFCVYSAIMEYRRSVVYHLNAIW